MPNQTKRRVVRRTKRKCEKNPKEYRYKISFYAILYEWYVVMVINDSTNAIQ